MLFNFWHKNALECELNSVYEDFGWKIVSTQLIFSENGKDLPACILEEGSKASISGAVCVQVLNTKYISDACTLWHIQYPLHFCFPGQ